MTDLWLMLAKVAGWRRVSRHAGALGALVIGCVVLAQSAAAHEMNPAIADVTVTETEVEIVATIAAEAWLAGVDLASVTDTNEAPEAGEYDALRALSPVELETRFRANWALLSDGFRVRAGDTFLTPELVSVSVTDTPDEALPRDTRLTLVATLPDDGSAVTVGWAARLGALILRQQGVTLAEGEEAYSAFLDAGQVSAELPRSGSAQVSGLVSFANYVWIGFLHILPKGLDHILFVLGLFFFALKVRPLLLQVTSFTVAHTLTLALATLGIVSVPTEIVEPLIAASIAWVAIENILGWQMTRLRLAVVFGFGLLHGLGFASVLGDIGLSPGHFIASLVAFNIGVELGQLTVIAAAFLAVGYWFGKKPWYRARIAVPASAAIAVMGLWWVVERTVL